MDARRIVGDAKRVAAVIAAVICLGVAVDLLLTTEKAYLLATESAAIVATARGIPDPTDETTRTVRVWAGVALTLAAAAGALLHYAAVPGRHLTEG